MMKPAGMHYKNGQPMYEQRGDIRTHFLENGKVKARGKMIEGKMEGEWIFNRASGELWQVGHFKNNQKQGNWVRYDRSGQKEYEAEFEADKLVKKLI